MIRLVADENMVGLDTLPDDIDVKAVPGRAIDHAMLLDADALWVRSVTRVDDALVSDTPLRFVGSATAGLEHVDQEALAARRIGFAAAPGANAMAVVEYVIAALVYTRDPWEVLARGGSLGIVGYGHVGQRLAAFARAMGWRYLVCDPLRAQVAQDRKAYVPLDRILSCDVISLHCSLHEVAPWPSRHLIGAAALGQLTPEQWLVNASRGAVIDTAALRDHLAGSDPARFVLDVWEGEPAIDAELASAAGVCLATPHIAGYSWDAKAKGTQRLLDAMREQGVLVAGDEATKHPKASGEPSVPFPGRSRDRDSAGTSGVTPDRAVGCAADGLIAGSGEDAVDGPATRARPGVARTAQELFEPVYNIAADDRRLRSVLSLADPVERAREFDRLRRDYPLRREVSRLLADGVGWQLSVLEGTASTTARALLAASSGA